MLRHISDHMHLDLLERLRSTEPHGGHGTLVLVKKREIYHGKSSQLRNILPSQPGRAWDGRSQRNDGKARRTLQTYEHSRTLTQALPRSDQQLVSCSQAEPSQASSKITFGLMEMIQTLGLDYQFV
ncbi:hypothetical protein L596_029689 [Steinernema carpocapsae]|uniref:Uncharacterized protein n=1 Tax=Steinernema carpocapsae TaxID=34508 RepID=A0A4U5LQI7_STECR|nr:hypothetical protein L596_029689 [Steinernema carpocapsae]